MFAAIQRFFCSRPLNSWAKNCRFISSDQSQHFQVTQSYNEAGSGISRRGYGEKEIYLLNPVDSRTPLPGNTGIVPLTVQFQDVSNSLSEHERKCFSLFAHSPEERHKDTLTQLIFTTVQNVLSSASPFECVVHECPQLLKKDFCDLFPNIDLRNDNLTVLMLCQQTEQDMKLWNETVEEERACLEKSFLIVAKAICTTLKDSGFWADYIHPSTGQPVFNSHISASKTTMFETDLRYSYFGFTIEDLGCCKVISHHLWGTHAFIGAIFTNAPLHSSEMQAVKSKKIVS